MARTRLTPVAATGPFPTAGVVATPVALDTSNGNVVAMSGRDLVLIFNSDSASHTVTFASTPDPQGRTGNITAEAVAAGVYKIFGPFGKLGWMQSGGDLFIDCSDATVKASVIQIP